MGSQALLIELRQLAQQKVKDRIFNPTRTETTGYTPGVLGPDGVKTRPHRLQRVGVNPFSPGVTLAHLKDLAVDLMALVPGLLPTYGPTKAIDRAQQKVTEDYDGNWYALSDITRMTFVCSSQEQLKELVTKIKSTCNHQGTRSILSAKERDPEKDDCGFSDFNFKITMPNGRPAEIQANTFAMLYGQFSAKLYAEILGDGKLKQMKDTLNVEGGRGHGLYEAFRIQKTSPLGREAQAIAKMYWAYLREGKGDRFKSADVRWALKRFMQSNPSYFNH